MTSLVEDDEKDAYSEAYPTLTRYFKRRRSCVMRFHEEGRKSPCRSWCGRHFSNLLDPLKTVARIVNFAKQEVKIDQFVIVIVIIIIIIIIITMTITIVVM